MKHTDIFTAGELELAHIAVLPLNYSGIDEKERLARVEVLIMAGNKISRTLNEFAIFVRGATSNPFYETDDIMSYGWNSNSYLPLAEVLKPYYNAHGIINMCVIKDLTAKLLMGALTRSHHTGDKLTVHSLRNFLYVDFSSEVDGLKLASGKPETVSGLMAGSRNILDDYDKMKQLDIEVYPRLVNAIMGIDNALICHGQNQFQGVIEMKEKGLIPATPVDPANNYGIIEEGGKVYHFIECTMEA